MLHDGAEAAVDLYWLPLGAGGHSVRVNGIVYEAISSLIHRRPRCDIYHAALEILAPSGRFAVEMTPVPNRRGWERGVVAGGAVGTRAVGRLRIFRYEIRRWRDGVIPDLGVRGGQSPPDQRGSCPRTPHPRAAPLHADADLGP